MKYPPRPLSQADSKRLLLACKTPRDRAMVVLLWRAGLRNFEACASRSEDYEERPEGAFRVHIPHGKGDRARFVSLDPKAAGFIRPLMGDGLILRTRGGFQLHTSNVRRSVRRIALTAGIRRRVHPHALRHTYARDLYEERFQVREIQVLLGHKSLATTQVYLQDIGCIEAAEQAEGREW